jgi:4'-phosphopantetheinyl transferase EntD
VEAEQIAQLFSGPVSVSVATPEMYDSLPYPEEQLMVARAIARRRREFAAGRACARHALGRFGVPASAIPAGPDRAPVWPEGYVGSITHCEGFCCAAVASADEVASIGIDAEDGGPLTPEMARIILTSDEMARFAALPELPESTWSKLAFSAKEAVYKCHFPLARARLDFHDIAILFSADGTFHATIAPVLGASADTTLNGLGGRWRVRSGRVYAGVTAPASGADRPLVLPAHSKP